VTKSPLASTPVSCKARLVNTNIYVELLWSEGERDTLLPILLLPDLDLLCIPLSIAKNIRDERLYKTHQEPGAAGK
jgi:hypothetical protein